MPNMNDPAEITFYYTAPLFLPATIDDTQFLGIYSSVSNLPTGQLPFCTAGVAGTGSMYVYLNNSWQYVGQYLYDAYRYLVYYQGSAVASASGTKWTSIFNDIASNTSLMTEFAGNSTAMTNIVGSSVAMTAIGSSSIAMYAVGNSTIAMNAILPNSNYTTPWWISSYYVGLGLNTYAGLNNSTLAGLNTLSNIVNNSNAMIAIANSYTATTAIAYSAPAISAVTYSSIAMNIYASSATALQNLTPFPSDNTTIANSSVAMNAIINSYTAMNAMARLVAKNAFQSASSQLSVIQTLVSNINSGSIVLGGGATGSSTALGLNALLVLLSYDNGAAVPAGNATSSPTSTLASKIYAAYSPTLYTYAGSSTSTAVVTLTTNQIVFAIGAYSSAAGNASGLGNASSYATNGTGAGNIIYTTTVTLTYPNEGTSPLLLSGTLYVEGASTTYYYYLTYTPS